MRVKRAVALLGCVLMTLMLFVTVLPEPVRATIEPTAGSPLLFVAGTQIPTEGSTTYWKTDASGMYIEKADESGWSLRFDGVQTLTMRNFKLTMQGDYSAGIEYYTLSLKIEMVGDNYMVGGKERYCIYCNKNPLTFQGGSSLRCETMWVPCVINAQTLTVSGGDVSFETSEGMASAILCDSSVEDGRVLIKPGAKLTAIGEDFGIEKQTEHDAPSDNILVNGGTLVLRGKDAAAGYIIVGMKSYYNHIYTKDYQPTPPGYKATVSDDFTGKTTSKSARSKATVTINDYAAKDSYRYVRIEPIKSTPTPPDTGDESQPILWAGLFMLGSIGLLLAARGKRRA